MMLVVGGRLHAEVVKAAQDGQRPLALHLLKRRKETEALLDQLRTHERSALTMLDELERVHTTRAMTDALDVGARAMQTAQRALPPVERIEALQDELAELADQNEAIRQALARGALLSTARGRCGRWLTRAGGGLATDTGPDADERAAELQAELDAFMAEPSVLPINLPAPPQGDPVSALTDRLAATTTADTASATSPPSRVAAM
jgi:hypothetical protein